MSLSLEALTILIILLPGFLCARILQALCVRPQLTDMDKILEALLYSFLIYVTFNVVVGSLEIRTKHLLILAAISVCWAMFITVLWTHDLVGKTLRPLRITQRTSRETVWLNTLHEYSNYVLVELNDGRLILGWVGFYSNAAPFSLFLTDAAWVTPEGEQIDIKGPGILISDSCGIKTMSFLEGIDTRKGRQ
ncbi:MAG: DUF6338 family protein [Acidobacteriia bacterium]|nr:DUF6338 family protein [Terriglobia bacterium]